MARNAFIIGVSAVVLTLAWWLSPVVGGILTIVASVILAAVLAPGTTDIDGQNGHDRSHDASWYL